MSSDAPLSGEIIAGKIAELRDRVQDAEAEVERLRTELEWWETGQRLFGDSFGSEDDGDGDRDEPENPFVAKAQTNGSKPTLREAILTLLNEQPTKTWKAEVLIEELRHRDWLPQGKNAEHHTRSMLAEMHRKGQARRMGRGRYRLPRLPTGDQ